MQHRKVGNLQLFALTFFLSHFFFLYYGNEIIKISKTDTIFACLLGTVFNILLFKLFLFFRKNFQKKLYFPKFLQYFLLCFLLLCSFFLLKKVSYFIKLNFLEERNIFQIGLLFTMIALIISKKNTPQVASLSLLCFFIFIVIFLSNMGGMIPYVTIDYIKPPFIYGFFPILKGACLFTIFSFIPLLLLWWIPYQEVDQRKKQNKYLYFALIISNLVTMIQYMMISFGPSLTVAETYAYPYMLIIHKISSFLILDRMSYLLSIYVLLDSTILLGLIFTIIKMLLPDKYNHFDSIN